MAERVKIQKVNKAHRELQSKDYLGIGLLALIVMIIGLIVWRTFVPQNSSTDTSTDPNGMILGYKDITQLELLPADNMLAISTGTKGVTLPTEWKLIGKINKLEESYYKCTSNACEVHVLSGLNESLRTMLVTTRGNVELRDTIPGDDSTQSVTLLGQPASMKVRTYRTFNGNPETGLTPSASKLVSTINVCATTVDLCLFAGPLTPDESVNPKQVEAFKALVAGLK